MPLILAAAISVFVLVAPRHIEARPFQPPQLPAAAAESDDAAVRAGFDQLTHGEYEAAAAAFRQVVERTPGLASGHFGLGLALANLHQYRDAAAAFARATALKPD